MDKNTCKKNFLFSTLLTSKGAVQEIGGAEFKLSTQPCLPLLLPHSPLAFSPRPLPPVLPPLSSPPHPPPLCSGWLSERPTVSFELLHRHPATIKLRAAPRHEIFTTQKGHIQSVSVERLVQRCSMKDRENLKGGEEHFEAEAWSFLPPNCKGT